MDLEDEANHFLQLLPHKSRDDILTKLRTFSHTTRSVRLCQMLSFFFKNDIQLQKVIIGNYEELLEEDLKCLKWFFPKESDEKIRYFLECSDNLPNRRYTVAKLLLGPLSERKRKLENHIQEEIEISSSKIIKTNSGESNQNGQFESKIPKLEIKRDKHSNEFKVSPIQQANNNKLTIETKKVNDVIQIQDSPLSASATGVIQIEDSPLSTTENKSGAIAFDKKMHKTRFQFPNLDLGPGPSHANNLSKINLSENLTRAAFLQNLDSEISNVSKSRDKSESRSPTERYYDLMGELLNVVKEHLSGDEEENDTLNDEGNDSNSSINSSNTLIYLSDNRGPNIPQETEQTTVENEQLVEVKDTPMIILESPQRDATPIVNLPVNEKLVLKIMEVFPEVCPDFIRNLCAGKTWSEHTFEQLMDTILTADNVPKRPERPISPEKEIDPEEQLLMLKSLLPDADPTFLQSKVDQLGGNQEAMAYFIEEAMDKKDYPTMKDYLRQQQLSAQHRQYTTEFDVKRFVEIFPDPVRVFEDPNRITNFEVCDIFYVKWFMRDKYQRLYIKDINYATDYSRHKNILSMINYLENCLKTGVKKSHRKVANIYKPEIKNIPLLQELAYFEHKEEILNHLKEKKLRAENDRLEAKTLGLLQTCSCCFDDEVMPSDILTCTGGCRFCRDCIKRSSEVAFGDGKIDFPCLSSGCNAEFSLQVLQYVLDPKLFSKIAQKKAVAEVKAAGLEDLESCPFCDFANIPAPEDKLFRCLNPDCMKESCRLCKEPSHVPLRCDEVEKDEAVKARTYIENKMAEALIRECWKCGAKFIKEEGCNKMKCSCGAMMCYICRQPVKDYTHFNGQGGDRFDLCPLYSDNVLANEKKVLEAAIEAKKQVNSLQLIHDPTVDVEQKYKDKIMKAEEKVKKNRKRIEDVVQQIRYDPDYQNERPTQLPRIPPVVGPANPNFNQVMATMRNFEAVIHIHQQRVETARQAAEEAERQIQAQQAQAQNQQVRAREQMARAREQMERARQEARFQARRVAATQRYAEERDRTNN